MPDTKSTRYDFYKLFINLVFHCKGGAGSDEEALSEEDSDDPIDDEPKDQSKAAAPKTKRRATKPKTAKKTKTNASGKKVNPLLAQLQQQEESKEEEEEEDGGQQETTEVKADEVWADFMADVGVKEKPAAPKPKAKGKSWAELLGNKKKKKPTPQNSSNEESSKALCEQARD